MTKHLPFFPMFLNVQGRKCVVVGGGKIAAAKIAGLLRHGATVVVVSPRAERTVKSLAQAGKLKWHRRMFSPADVKDAFLLIAATNSSSINGEVFAACRERRILCNSVDDPDHCDFFYPAVVRRGPLQIAISTNGYSPALSSRLRKDLGKQFGREWAWWVEHIGKLRREISTGELSPAARRRHLLQLASPEAFSDFVRNHQKGKSAKVRSK